MRINCGIFLEAALAANGAVVSVGEICKSDKMRRFVFAKMTKTRFLALQKWQNF